MAANPLPDPLGAARITAQNLAIWRDDPGRLPEDLAAESELAHIGYRGRVVTELLQNAADAADDDGLVEVRLFDDPDGGPVLEVANSGRPLDTAGLIALAALRRSSKADPERSLGHFGVGFASVLSVSDNPHIGTAETLIAFDAERTRAAAERSGPVPILRTPFVVPGQGRSDFATTVRLPLRDDQAVVDVRAEIETLGDWVLAAMPTLTSIGIIDELSDVSEYRVISNISDRWDLVHSRGKLPLEVKNQLPKHRQYRDHWNISWAFLKQSEAHGPRRPHGENEPADALRDAFAQLDGTFTESALTSQVNSSGNDGFGYICAPTPTKEKFSWPAGLIATFPISEDRQHIVDGAVTDYLIDQAAQLFVDHITKIVHTKQSWWHYLPSRAQRTWLAAKILARIEELLADAAVIAATDWNDEPRADVGDLDEDDPLCWRPKATTPQQSSFLAHPQLAQDSTLVQSLAAAGVVLAKVPASYHEMALRLGMTSVTLAAALRQLEFPGLATQHNTRDTSVVLWTNLVTALARHCHDPDLREALTELPVPLIDGRLVHGPRGCLVVAGEQNQKLRERLLVAGQYLGLRLVDPIVVADEPCLDIVLQAGAQRFTAQEFLQRGELRRWVQELHEDPDNAGRLPGIQEIAPLGQTQGNTAAMPAWQLCFETMCLALDEHYDQLSGAGEGQGPATKIPHDFTAPNALVQTTPANPISDLFGQVLLPDSDGEPCPAGELTLTPAGVLSWFDPDLCSQLDDSAAENYSKETFTTLGVTAALTATTFDLVDLSDSPMGLLSCDGFEEWVETLPPGIATSVSVIQGLEFIATRHWRSALQLIGDDPELLQTLDQKVEIQGHDGHTYSRASFSLWWLRRELDLAGTTNDPQLQRWLPAAPGSVVHLPSTLLTMLGVATSYQELNADMWHQVLESMGHKTTQPEPHELAECWLHFNAWIDTASLSAGSSLSSTSSPLELQLPEFLWVPSFDGPAYVESADLVVSPQRRWHFHPGAGPLIPVCGHRADRIAEVLDLALWSELSEDDKPAGAVDAVGEWYDLPDLLCNRLNKLNLPIVRYLHCTTLAVDGTALDWWFDGDELYVTAVEHLLAAVALVSDDACAAASWIHAAQGDQRANLWQLLGPPDSHTSAATTSSDAAIAPQTPE